MVKRMLGALSQSIALSFNVVAIHSRSHGDSLGHEAVDAAKSCVCDTHELLSVIYTISPVCFSIHSKSVL